MSKIKNSAVALFFAALFIFSSCENEDQQKSKLLTKKWAYQEFKMNDETFSSDQLGDPIMEFFNDGKYRLDFGPMSDSGTWKIEEGRLVTYSKEENNAPNYLEIKELSEEKLLLYSDVEGNQAYITLVPAKE